ncbi:MAG: DVUA0089 family protein [Gemmataceae bacterium]
MQRTGVVGDDPAYDDYLFGMNGADVDLFHFQVSGSGWYRFQTEVFAGRIGSMLDPGVSLFRLDPSDGLLHLVQANDNTGNLTTLGEGWPIYTDASLFAGLTAGDYYLAVSASGNTPDLDLGMLPGPDYGIFDPNVSHSGLGGYSTGAYVLNLMVEEDNAPPQVIATSVTDGMTLDGPPVRLIVQFDEAVNLAQMSHRAIMMTGQGGMDAVFVLGADGVAYYPRLETYDPASNQATFLMYDGLPAGPAELHLSGSLGLTDLADLPLAGNSSDGDYVVRFTVGSQARGTNGNPLQWNWEPSHDTIAQAQNLGSLFENELAAESDGTLGIGVRRDFSQHPQTSPDDTADYYAFELQKTTNVLLTLTGPDLPDEIRLELVTESEDLGVITYVNSQGVFASLAAGRYVIRVTGWPTEMAIGEYEVRIGSLYRSENPTPLTVGPAPALRVRLVTLPAPVITGSEAPVDTPVVRAASASSKPAESAPGPTLPTGVLTAMAAGPVGGVTPAGSLDAQARAVAVHLPQTPSAWISSVVGKLMATLLYLAQPVAAQSTVNAEVEGAGPPAGDELRQGFSLGLPGLDDLFQYVQRAGEKAVAPLMHLNGRWMHAPTAPDDVAESEVPTADVVLASDTPMRVGMIPTAALALAALAVLLLLPRIHTPNREELLLNARRVRR